MDIRRTTIYAESWNVAYRQKTQASILQDKDAVFHILPNTWRYWAADPMVFEENGKTYIFAELYDYIRTRGIIGIAEFKNGKFTPWKPIIIETFHMSYPFVFKQGKDIFMMPETSAANELFLYRATEFPYKWEKHKSIKKDIMWVDTTITSCNGGYVGFTEDLAKKCDYKLSFDNALNLKTMEEMIDIPYGQGRMGGPIFSYGSGYIKVCQDCLEDYGKALMFQFLDDKFKNEKEIARIEPGNLKLDKKLLLCGMHTYSATDKIEVVDIKTRRFNIVDFVFRACNKIRMCFGKKN